MVRCPPLLQKTKIPARGLKLVSGDPLQSDAAIQLQKTKIPARGLKPQLTQPHLCTSVNIRLQKTKIPARGLKRNRDRLKLDLSFIITSKNQNPREGIETLHPTQISNSLLYRSSKNQNPREGIETVYGSPVPRTAWNIFKKPKSPRGD